MSTFLHTAAKLTASDIQRLQQSTPASRTKVMALGLGVLIPTTIWVVCSFLLAYSVLNVALFPAIAISAVLGFLVMTIERLIVMGNGNWVVSSFRILLAGVVAYLGAQLFDLVLFKTDIDQKLPEIRHQQALLAQKNSEKQWEERYDIKGKEKDVQDKWAGFQGWQLEASNEAGGLSSNKIKGAGSATKFKQGVANAAKGDYLLAKNELDKIKQEGILKQTQAYDAAYKDFNENSLLFRMKAMHLLITENSEMKGLYRGITLFLFLIEFLVLIFKLTWPKTAYDKEIAMLEELHTQRTERQKVHHVVPGLQKISRGLQTRLNTLL